MEESIARKIISMAVELFEEDVDEKTKIGDIEKWDSLGHINIFMRLSEEFNIEFDPEDIFNAKSLKEIIDLVVKHVNK